MSVNIVTGFTGRAHITSDDDRIRNAAYIGTDKFVMPFGNQFEAEVQNNNLVRIKDGMLMNQGTQMGIELTDYEDVVIENGLSGTNRNDLIVMRYEKQDDTGLESASLVVIKGTSGATASDPTYISGNIIDGGDLIDDYPLYRVKIESLSIVAVQQLFSTRADVGSELNRIETAFNNKMEKNNPTGTGSFSMNRKENTTVGSKSVAVNRNTTASGDSSFASGFNTTASGDYSNAAGNSTTASGGYSHSDGANTTASNTASHAEGSSTTASAYNSHAEGESTTASGRASHAEGMNTTASGERSHAAGYWTTAGYSNQTVVGKHNDNKETNLFEVGNGISSSNRSNALEVRQNGDVHAGGDFYDGNGNKVGGDITSKMNKTNPTGTGSFSMNRKANTTVGGLSATVNENNTASGDGSFASGRNNTASGLYSNASGTSTTASGSCSRAEGMNTTASGSCSHSEGESTTASGRASHSEGMNTTASGERSHAAGYWTTAGYSNQTVVGKHNDNKETNLFEVGNGISGNSKSNAFEVSESGNAIAGADLLYDGHKRITGSYASDILVECTDLKIGPDNTITGRDEDNVPIHTGTYDLKVGSIIYVPEDLHFGMNVPAGIYEVLYLVDGGNGISYLSFGDYQRYEPDPTHVKYMPKSLEERIETALSTTKTATGNPISISDSAHVNAEKLVVTLEPIQSGSGDPSPENIRPISGYDETSVVRSGKNLLPLTVDGIKALNTKGTWSGNVFTYRDVTCTILTDDANNVTGIKFNGTASANLWFRIVPTDFDLEPNTIINGCPDNGFFGTYCIRLLSSNDEDVIGTDVGSGITISNPYENVNMYILISNGYTANNIIFKPMIRLATETAASYEPYTANTYTLQFGDTVYGAEVDFVNGVATVTKGYIAEYAGETLPSTWISDRDVYASGTTPTTGAQVVYKLASPQTIQLTPQQIKMLKGNNVLTADGDMELEYQADSVVGDVKEWAEEEFLPKSYGPVGAPFSIIFTETDSGGYTSVFTCNKTHSEIVDYIFENGLSNVTAEIRGYNGYRQIAVNCGSSKSDDVYFTYTQYVSSSSLVFSSLRMTSTDTIVFNQARAQIQS